MFPSALANAPRAKVESAAPAPALVETACPLALTRQGRYSEALAA